jgi:Na+-transporting NADH:ubiquinone oxidoreductase subunit NqrF
VVDESVLLEHDVTSLVPDEFPTECRVALNQSCDVISQKNEFLCPKGTKVKVNVGKAVSSNTMGNITRDSANMVKTSDFDIQNNRIAEDIDVSACSVHIYL